MPIVVPASEPLPDCAPGVVLARGVCRALVSMGFAPLTEFVPARGLRMDVVALGPKGEIWGIECKSSRSDFRSDHKWVGYLDWCDRFFWAVGPDFPFEILPEGHGIIVADGYGAEVLAPAPNHSLAGARRKVITRSIARTASLRVHMARDPHAV